jgi:hypothetical protein
MRGNLGPRALVCLCTACTLLLGMHVAVAAASTSIGQLDPGTPTGSCVGQSGWVQSAEASAPSYTVPAGRWVLVSWAHRSNTAAGRELGVRVWRATATAGTYALVGAGALRILTPGGINTFDERIPVSGGDLLGLRVGNPGTVFPDVGGGASCAFSAAVGNSVRYGVLTSEPASGSNGMLPALVTSYRLNVTARLEPDADADGFGDETQDSCPGSAGLSSGCAPAGGGPPKDTTRPTAKLRVRRDSIRDGHVGLWVTASEAAKVTMRGSVKIGSGARVHRLRTASANAAANTLLRLSLRMSKKTRLAARRALRRGQRLRARFTVTVQDAAGNAASAKAAVRLKL